MRMIRTGAVVAAALVAVVTGGATAAAVAPSATLVDTSALQVHYNGSVISNDAAVELQTEAQQAGREFVLVYDAASSTEGRAHAFDSAAQADR